MKARCARCPAYTDSTVKVHSYALGFYRPRPFHAPKGCCRVHQTRTIVQSRIVLIEYDHPCFRQQTLMIQQ